MDTVRNFFAGMSDWPADQQNQSFNGIIVLKDEAFWLDRRAHTKAALSEEEARKSGKRDKSVGGQGDAAGVVKDEKTEIWDTERGWQAARVAFIDRYDEEKKLATHGKKRAAIDGVGDPIDGIIFEPDNWEARHNWYHEKREEYLPDDRTAALRLIDDDRYAHAWSWDYAPTRSTSVVRQSDHNKGRLHDIFIVRQTLYELSLGEHSEVSEMGARGSSPGTSGEEWILGDDTFTFQTYQSSFETSVPTAGPKRWNRQGATTFDVAVMWHWNDPATIGSTGGWVHTGVSSRDLTERYEPNIKIEPYLVAQIGSCLILTEDDIWEWTEDDHDGVTYVNIRDDAHFHMTDEFDGRIYFVNTDISSAIDSAGVKIKGYMALDTSLKNDPGSTRQGGALSLLGLEAGEWRPVVGLVGVTEVSPGWIYDRPLTMTELTVAGSSEPGPTAVTFNLAPGSVSYAEAGFNMSAAGMRITGDILSIAQKTVHLETVYLSTMDEKVVDEGVSICGDMCVFDTANDRVGFGTNAPQTPLHVAESSGAIQSTTHIVALLQNNASASDSSGVSILAGTSGTSRVCFSDTDDLDVGEIVYGHNNATFVFRVAATNMLRLSATELCTANINEYANGAGVTIKNARIRADDGTVGAPTWSFYSDSDTGFYRPSANVLCCATDGTKRVEISSAGLDATGFLAGGVAGVNYGPININDHDTGGYFTFQWTKGILTSAAYNAA